MRVSGIEPLAVDTPIIASLVVAIATHAKAARLVEAEGVLVTGRDGSPVRNPAGIVAAQSARLVDSLSSSLGLTPASRQRLRAHQAALFESASTDSPESYFAS
jgi:P27 family predicted phage terminase small subunit